MASPRSRTGRSTLGSSRSKPKSGDSISFSLARYMRSSGLSASIAAGVSSAMTVPSQASRPGAEEPPER